MTHYHRRRWHTHRLTSDDGWLSKGRKIAFTCIGLFVVLYVVLLFVVRPG